jgi:hypothetical protein
VKVRKRQTPGKALHRKPEPKIHILSFFVDIGEQLPRAITLCGQGLDDWAEVVTAEATCIGCLKAKEGNRS